VGVYHDGTTHEGEAFAIINRWADEDLNTRLRALVVRFLDGSVDNKQIASLILQAESESGHVALSDILAIMIDSVSANLTACIETFSATLPYADDEQCLPHTNNNAGECFHTPILDLFMGAYNQATAKSHLSLSKFTTATGETAKKKNKGTRWWKEELIKIAAQAPAAVQLAETQVPPPTPPLHHNILSWRFC